MASNLTRMLESLSGYRHLFTPGSPEAAKNPVVYSFLQVKVGGEQRLVLSRVADTGVDYSGRSNKLAHHISLPANSQAVSGPTRLLLDKQFFCSHWQGDPKLLKPRPLLKNVSAPKPCKFWQKVTGDAGWAGDLIDACQTGKIIYLIVEPTTPAAALLHEALSLLPQQKQWQTTFSSFYRRLPPNVQCQIRCVMADSPEIEMTRQSQNNVVWDLTKPLGSPKSHLADHARKGKTITGSESRPIELPDSSTTTNAAAIDTPTPSRKNVVPTLGKRPPELPSLAGMDAAEALPAKRNWLMPIVSILGLLTVAAAFAILFIPGLKEQVLSGFAPALPPDIVQPTSTNPIVEPQTDASPRTDPDADSVSTKPVFERLIPPGVLSPPINSVPADSPTPTSPHVESISRLTRRDISFSPQWQSFQKSRFPQAVLLIRHDSPFTNSLQLSFSDGQRELVMKTAGDRQWDVAASGRQIGKFEFVEHELGWELEFQCDLDDTGTPTVFLDAIDQLNQSVMVIQAGDLPATSFEIGTQFIQAHLNLDNRHKRENLSFGIGGSTLTETLASRDVTLNLFQNTLLDPTDDALKETAEDSAAPEEARSADNEIVIPFPVPFNQETIQAFTPLQMKRFDELNAHVNLRVFKELGQPIGYQWSSFTFTVAETEITAQSWKFQHHPIDVVSRELKKQLKAIGDRLPDAQTAGADLLAFLDAAKMQTSKTLQVAQLMPGRLESPIEMKSDKGQRYLVFIDIGEQSQPWSPQEMRMSYHGVTSPATE